MGNEGLAETLSRANFPAKLVERVCEAADFLEDLVEAADEDIEALVSSSGVKVLAAKRFKRWLQERKSAAVEEDEPSVEEDELAVVLREAVEAARRVRRGGAETAEALGAARKVGECLFERHGRLTEELATTIAEDAILAVIQSRGTCAREMARRIVAGSPKEIRSYAAEEGREAKRALERLAWAHDEARTGSFGGLVKRSFDEFLDARPELWLADEHRLELASAPRGSQIERAQQNAARQCLNDYLALAGSELADTGLLVAAAILKRMPAAFAAAVDVTPACATSLVERRHRDDDTRVALQILRQWLARFADTPLGPIAKEWILALERKPQPPSQKRDRPDETTISPSTSSSSSSSKAEEPPAKKMAAGSRELASRSGERRTGTLIWKTSHHGLAREDLSTFDESNVSPPSLYVKDCAAFSVGDRVSYVVSTARTPGIFNGTYLERLKDDPGPPLHDFLPRGRPRYRGTVVKLDGSTLRGVIHADSPPPDLLLDCLLGSHEDDPSSHLKFHATALLTPVDLGTRVDFSLSTDVYKQHQHNHTAPQAPDNAPFAMYIACAQIQL